MLQPQHLTFGSNLDERGRRLFAAGEVRTAGWGGLAVAHFRLERALTMARKFPATDVVIIGLGWTGSILAYEMAKAGLNVMAIERSPWRDTASGFPPAFAQDELRYVVRLDLFLRTQQETMTFRNNASQTALPVSRHKLDGDNMRPTISSPPLTTPSPFASDSCRCAVAYC